MPLIQKFYSNIRFLTPRQERQFDFISQFTNKLEHISGKLNFVADALSRPATSAQVHALVPPSSGINYKDLAMAQSRDPDISQFRKDNTTSLILDEVLLDGTADPLVCDISTSRRRPIVPDILRYHIFSDYHGVAHPGVRTSIKLVSRVFVWPSMRRDITRWVRECHACQRNKIQRHTKAPLQKVSSPPKGRFTHVYVDLTGPMEESYGYFYLLVVICKFSRFMHAIPLRGITAAEVTDAFVRHWVALFGCPEHIFSDRGRQFTSHRWRNMGNFMGSKLHHSTSYHPQANASIERLNRTLKQPLRCFEQPGKWYDNLPWVLLS